MPPLLPSISGPGLPSAGFDLSGNPSLPEAHQDIEGIGLPVVGQDEEEAAPC